MQRATKQNVMSEGRLRCHLLGLYLPTGYSQRDVFIILKGNKGKELNRTIKKFEEAYLANVYAISNSKDIFDGVYLLYVSEANMLEWESERKLCKHLQICDYFHYPTTKMGTGIFEIHNENERFRVDFVREATDEDIDSLVEKTKSIKDIEYKEN